VDDSPTDRTIYRRYLYDAYDLHEADRGANVLALCQTLQPACLLLDYRLPDEDGLALLRRVRAQYEAQVLPVVFLTGQGSETVAVEALKQGAQDYLVKDTLQPDALARAIRQAIDTARQFPAPPLRDRFRAAFETPHDAFYIVDTAGRVTFANAVFAALTGYQAEEVFGQPASLFYPPEAPDLFADPPVSAHNGLRLSPWFEADLLCKDGRQIHVEVSVTSLVVHDQITGRVVALRDITERTRAEERFRLVVEAAPNAMVMVDPHGQIVLVNAQVERLFGYPRADLLGQPVERLLPDRYHVQHVQDRTQYMAAPTGRAMGAGRDLYGRRSDGTEFPVEIGLTPIDTREGVFVLSAIVDISVRRQLEAELLRASKVESVGLLAAGIAHDFNNLLTGILGNISLAKQFVRAHDKAVGRLAEAERACQRATALTQQLLTFAKGNAPVRQLVGLADFLRDIVPFALRGTNVRSRFHLPDDLWAVEIDPGQMQQVFQNVVLNAVQAMPAGGMVEVQADNYALSPDIPLALPAGRYVRIIVRDQGDGIPPEVLPNVFDPYFTTKAHGRGLGLAVAYAVLTKHAGTITVESAVGEGTTVTLYVPASAHVPCASPPLPAGLQSQGHGRMLVVDDEESVRDVLQEMLTHVGYTVDTVAEGKAAIAHYAQALAAGERYAAVILDYMLPGGMGGCDILEQLRTLDPQVTALLSSGYADAPILADFAQYGFRGVVPKPYTLETLVDVLHRALGL
jgi:PAS domain S-box-containing protein